MREIVVYAEMTCPFTHVGLRRIVERLHASSADAPRLRLRAWPLELVNGEPLDPHHVAEEIAALRTEVAPELFEGFDPGRFPTSSMLAFGLADAAYARDAPTGLAVSMALRRALFEDGDDIGDPAVVAAVGARHGVDLPAPDAAAAAARADWEEGRARGVVGSPHFFVGERGWFCPLLDIGRNDDGSLRVVPDRAALEEFLAFVRG